MGCERTDIMGVRVLSDRNGQQAALYCSTTGVAFGPVFSDSDDHDADERADAFVRWLPLDARRYEDAHLLRKYSEWQAQEAAQWVREDCVPWEAD
jgi:hypothetical protein